MLSGLLLGFPGRGEGVLWLGFFLGLRARGGLSQRESIVERQLGCELRTVSQSMLPGACREPVIASRLGEARAH